MGKRARVIEFPEGVRIRGASSLFPFVRRWGLVPVETFLAAEVREDRSLIALRVVAEGGSSCVAVSAADVYRMALVDRAYALYAVHNHPSGTLSPSENDDAVTRALVRAGKIFGIPLLDHVIVTRDGFWSYEDNGRLV